MYTNTYNNINTYTKYVNTYTNTYINTYIYIYTKHILILYIKHIY